MFIHGELVWHSCSCIIATKAPQTFGYNSPSWHCISHMGWVMRRWCHLSFSSAFLWRGRGILLKNHVSFAWYTVLLNIIFVRHFLLFHCQWKYFWFLVLLTGILLCLNLLQPVFLLNSVQSLFWQSMVQIGFL